MVVMASACMLSPRSVLSRIAFDTVGHLSLLLFILTVEEKNRLCIALDIYLRREDVRTSFQQVAT